MIEQMQAFWTGDARAAALLDAHPLLAVVPREALLETVRRGCGFHNIWDVRALGQLRDVLDRAAAAADGGAAATALSELHAALAAGGGLRAQARAVGMLLFRVAAREYGELQEQEQHSTGDTAAATAALAAPVGGGAAEQALAQEPEHGQEQLHQVEQPTLPAASPPRGSSHEAPPSPPLAQNHTMSASSMSLGGISSISSPGSFSGSSELPTTAGAGAATCAAHSAACAFPRRYRLSRWLPPGAVLRVRTAAGIGPGSTVIGLLGAGVECEAVAEKRLPPSNGDGGGAEHWVEVRLAGLRLAPPPPAETTSSSEVGAAAPTAWVMATMPPAAAAAAAAAAATHPPPVCNWGPGVCEDGAAATHYCGSCAERLCTECLATHRRARATRSHTAAIAAKPAPGSAAAAARLAPLLEEVIPFGGAGGSGGCGDSSNTSGDGFGAAAFSAAMMSSSSVSSVDTVSVAGASLVSSESRGGAGSGCFLDQSSLSLSMSEVSNIVDRSGPGAVEAVVSHALAPTATGAAHNGAATAQDSQAEPAAAEEFDAAAVAAAAAASSAVAAAAAASVAMKAAAAAEGERVRECEAEMRHQATSAAISSAVIAAITAARCAANDAIDAADRALGAAALAATQAMSTPAADEDQVDEERRRRRKEAQTTELLEDEQKAVDLAAKRRATEEVASAEATAAAAVQAFAAAAAATAAADDAVADANAVAAHEAAVAAETAAEAAAADAEEAAIAADERESLAAATAATSSRRAALRAEIEQLDAGLGGEGWKVRLAALQRFVAAALALAAADAAAAAVARAEAATRRALRGRRCGSGSDHRRVRAVVPATVSSAEAGASADLSLSLWRLASLLGDIMADKSQHAQVAREVARTVELLSAGHALGTDAAGCRCSDAAVAEGGAVRGSAPASATQPDMDASAVLSAAQVSSLSLDLSEDAVNDRDEDDYSGDSGDGATAGHSKSQRRDRCAAVAKVRSDARREAAALASRLVAPLLARLGCRDATLGRAIGAALDKLYRHALPLRRCLRLTTPLLEAPPAPKSTRLGSPDRGDSRGPRAVRSTPPKRAGVNGGTAGSTTLGSGASLADGPLSAPKQQAPPLARARVLGWLGRCMLSAYRHRLALLQVQQRQQQEAGTSPRGQEAHQHEQVERWLVFTPAPPELASLLLPSLTDREQKVRIRPPACFGWCCPLLTALLALHSLTVSCSAGSCGGSAGTGICAAIAALARTF